VLDAPTRCSDRPPHYGHAVECLLVEVQHDAIAPVSYGVRLDLQPPTERLGQDRKQRGLAVNRQPSGIGSIAIRREQGCTARAECAIDVELDPADRQPVAAAIDRRTLREEPLHVGARAVDRIVQSQLDPPRGVQPAQEIDFMETIPGNLQLRPSEAHAALGPQLQCPLGLRIRRRRNQVLNQVHGIVDQHARGLAGRGIFENATPSRVRGVAVDARKLEREAVDHRGVPVRTLKKHRPIAGDLIQVGAARKGWRRPARLDPSSPREPLAGRPLLCALAKPVLQVCNARGAFQIEAQLPEPDTGQVGV